MTLRNHENNRILSEKSVIEPRLRAHLSKLLFSHLPIVQIQVYRDDVEENALNETVVLAQWHIPDY